MTVCMGVSGALPLWGASCAAGKLDDARDDIFEGEAGGVDHDGVGCGFQGGRLAFGVALVADAHGLADAVELGLAGGLGGAAAGALVGGGR